MVYHFAHLECVSESGSRICPRLWPWTWPFFFAPPSCSDLGRTRLETQFKTEPSKCDKQASDYVSLCSTARTCITVENIVLFVVRRSPSSTKRAAMEHQKIPELVSLSGKFQQSVVTPSEQSLCLFLFHGQESQISCFLDVARRFFENMGNNAVWLATNHDFNFST